MKIAAALTGITHLFLDTSLFIYFVEKNPTYYARAEAVFRRINAGGMMGQTSVVTLSEVLTRPLKVGDTAIVRAYRNLILFSRNLGAESINPVAAEQAAQLRAAYNLKTPDALQVAVAITTGCNAFLTNDRGLKRIQEIPVLILDDLRV